MLPHIVLVLIDYLDSKGQALQLQTMPPVPNLKALRRLKESEMLNA
jgi:hypothetical protein